MSVRRSAYRRDIQALRGVSILAVLLFHARPSAFPLGYLGVDAFFVISGFVVTPLIIRAIVGANSMFQLKTNLKDFYLRRFYRLAPALSSALIASAILMLLFDLSKDLSRFAEQGIATLLLVGNVGAFRFSGDYFAPHANALVHMWSLSVEEQIYLFLPLAMIFLLRQRFRNSRWIFRTLLILGTVSFTCFLLPNLFQPIYLRLHIYSGSQFYFYSPLTRTWEFILGGLGYLATINIKTRIQSLPKLLDIAFIMTLLGFLFLPFEISIRSAAFVVTISALLLCLFGSLNRLPEEIMKPLEWMGDRSYSIYLLHWPLIYVALYSPIVAIGADQNRNFQVVISLILSVIAGSMSYSKIENRFRLHYRIIDGRSLQHTKLAVVALGIPMILFIGIFMGGRNHFWGLDHSPETPVYAANLDSDCKRQTETGPACFYNIPGATKTVVLFGDSHAGQFSQAIVDAAHMAHWNSVVYTHGGCQVQFKVSQKREISAECLEVNQQMLAWIKTHKPSALVISQFVQDVSNLAELKRALSELQQIVPNVLMISNTPIFPDGGSYMVSRPLLSRPYDIPKSFPLGEMVNINNRANDEVTNWAKIHGIRTLKSDSLFCNVTSCNRWSLQGWLYRDDDHLSALGASRFVPSLKSFLESVT